jgi:hypothetical protein
MDTFHDVCGPFVVGAGYFGDCHVAALLAMTGNLNSSYNLVEQLHLAPASKSLRSLRYINQIQDTRPQILFLYPVFLYLLLAAGNSLLATVFT